MSKRKLFIALVASAVVIPAAVVTAVAVTGGKTFTRPEGPCDVYADGGAPCAAAHSTTRALYASYDGPLYQIMRQSDGKTLDIGVVEPNGNDGGGYADAAAQDEFCKDTYCWITVIYDQSGNENHLMQAPHGGFSGPAMGGFNNVPVADWAPVTLMGHKVYGVFIAPGMGMRWNDAKGTAVDDQAEGQYWVISGHHYNTGCCFDYGNAETDSRDDGDGTMETTYFGNQPSWYRGSGPGPWIMTDQENNLVGCVNPDPNDKYCPDIPSVSWRFITATADGEPHHWRSMGGNAQGGELLTMYDGQRIQNARSSYDPMRKQGAILLGNGGDNSNGSSGTFYEGAMTKPGTFPTIETNQAVQANVVAAGYNLPTLSVAGATKTDAPNGLQTFAPASTASTTVTFVNTTNEPISDLQLSIDVPKGWKSFVMGGKEKVRDIGYTVAPGQTVVATFSVRSSGKPFNGDLVARAQWTGKNGVVVEKAVEKVRNVAPVKINEFRVADGKGNQTNSFIELYNASDLSVDISGWTLTEHAINIPSFSSIRIPNGTRIAPKGFYLLGLANSGLSVQAAKGDKIIYVRDVRGISAGDEIEIGGEVRKVAGVISPAQPEQVPGQRPRGNAPAGPTTIWQPLPEGPVITIPAGSTNIPVASINGFKKGDKMAIGYNATYPAVSNSTEKYEIVTITEVGKPGTQAWLSMDAKPGDTNIKVSSTSNISVGDKIRLDIASEGHGIETVTVKAVGTASSRSTFNGPLGPDDNPGTGLELEEPLKYAHSSNMPFSVNGTGISFEPASRFDHSSNEPVLPLIYAIELDEPLASAHPIDEVVFDANVTTAGYQGQVAADQLFGGPALNASQGNMVLRTAKGLIVDALNYGGVVDPWLGEGYHGEAGAGAGGSYAAAPSAGGRRGFGAAPVSSPDVSSGRYPDGNDTDDNKRDFRTQSSFSIASAAKAGSDNIKVTGTQGVSIGKRFYIGSGDNLEAVNVAVIGTTGCTVLAKDAAANDTELAVASSQGFSAGQTIYVTVDGKDIKAVVQRVVAAPRRFGYGMPQNAQAPTDTIVLNEPLGTSVSAGAQVAGSGLSLGMPLRYDHSAGEIIATAVPTPGMPNVY